MGSQPKPRSPPSGARARRSRWWPGHRYHPVAHAVKASTQCGSAGREGSVVDALAYVGQRTLPASSASSVSRSCTEAGTTATASQWPSRRPAPPACARPRPRPRRTPRATHRDALTVACRRCRGSALVAGRPAPATARHVPQRTEQAQVEPAPDPAVDGPPGGSPAAGTPGPPTRKCHAIAPTTRRVGVARPLRGGSAGPAILLGPRPPSGPIPAPSNAARAAPVAPRPHLPVTPCVHIRVAHLEPRRSDGTACRTALNRQSARPLCRIVCQG